MPNLLQQGTLAGSTPNFNAYTPSPGLLPALARKKQEEDEKKRKEAEAKKMAAMDVVKPVLAQMNQSRPVDFEAYKPIAAPAPQSIKPTLRNQLTMPSIQGVVKGINYVDTKAGTLNRTINPAMPTNAPTGILGQIDQGLGMLNRNINPAMPVNAPESFQLQGGQAVEQLTGSQTAGALGAFAFGLAEPFPAGGVGKGISNILHPEDANVLMRYINKIRTPKAPTLTDFSEADFVAVERLLTRTGASLDKPVSELANHAQNILEGNIDTRPLYQTGRKFANETPPEPKIRNPFGADLTKKQASEEFGEHDKVLLTHKASGDTQVRFVYKTEDGLSVKDDISGIPRRVDPDEFDVKLVEKNSLDSPRRRVLGINSAEMIAEEAKATQLPKSGKGLLQTLNDQKFPQAFKGFKDITTRILDDLKGRTTVSKQYLLDATNRPELKQSERDLTRHLLEDEGGTVVAKDFANKVKTELLPLKRVSLGDESDVMNGGGGLRYENITLPDELRGAVRNYDEHIYDSPIKTSAGKVHFGDNDTGGYFAHSRIEDLADEMLPDGTPGYNDSGTRRVIEIQSDLFQKGRLEQEMPYTGFRNAENIKKTTDDVNFRVEKGTMSRKEADEFIEMEKKAYAKLEARDKELNKLEPYRNTWHERVIREEVKQAAKDGKTKLQFPTGETAMKIEGLVNRHDKWVTLDNQLVDGTNIKKGDLITVQTHERVPHEDRRWLITKNNGDGTFKAVDSMTAQNDSGFYDLLNKKGLLDDGRVPSLDELQPHLDDEGLTYLDKLSENLSAQNTIDTNNPVYRFYEKEVGRYITKKYGGRLITDPQGVKWWEMDVHPKDATAPVGAFGGTKVPWWKEERGFIKNPLAREVAQQADQIPPQSVPEAESFTKRSMQEEAPPTGIRARDFRRTKPQEGIEDKLLEARMERDFLNDAIRNSPVRRFLKYVNKGNQSLGTPDFAQIQQTAIRKGTNAKNLDEELAEAGFRDFDELDRAFEQYTDTQIGRNEVANRIASLRKEADQARKFNKAMGTRETPLSSRMMKEDPEAQSIQTEIQLPPQRQDTLMPNEVPKNPRNQGSPPPNGPDAPQSFDDSLPSGDSTPPRSGVKLPLWRKLMTSGRAILEKSGESGTKLARTLETQRLEEDLLVGKYQTEIKKALKGLNEGERLQVTDALEGKKTPVNLKIAAATERMRVLLDEIGTRAESDGFLVRVGEKALRPFHKRANYFPRQYEVSELVKGARREKAIAHLVATGQAANPAKAEKLLDDFIMQSGQRRAGNIENARQLDLPDYEKDPLKALPKYTHSVARRFTEAEYFGKKDEVVNKLIREIAGEGGDYKEAQRIFDFITQGIPKNKVVSAITQFNVATKLSLAFITNATQTVNTMTKAGVWNTLKGIYKGFTTEGREMADLINAYDDFILVKELGVEPHAIVRGSMYVFKKVEEFNRRTATNTGALYAAQLAGILKKDPKSASTIRQLESLGISVEKALTGKLTDDDLLVAASKMIEKTQFKIDPLELPPSWRTPTGRLLSQFKSFLFMQTRFVRDEVVKEARHGNFTPLVTFVLLAPIASLITQAIRNKVTGREQDNIDIRQWDKWMKAFGTIPTEAVIQGKFLYDTMKSDLKTPIEKGARVAGTLFGPTADEFGKVIGALERIPSTKEKNKYLRAKGKEQDPYLGLKRIGTEKIPYVGQYLKNKFFDYPKSTKTPEEKAKNRVMYDLIDKLYEKPFGDAGAKKELTEYIRGLPDDEQRRRQLYIMGENGLDTKGISTSGVILDFNADPEKLKSAEEVYKKIQSFNPSKGWTKAEKAARDAYGATLSEEDYTLYTDYKEKYLPAYRRNNTETIRNLLETDPKAASEFGKTLPQEEQERILNTVLTDAEYAKLKGEKTSALPQAAQRLHEDGSFTGPQDVRHIKEDLIKKGFFTDNIRAELAGVKFSRLAPNTKGGVLQKGKTAAGEYSMRGLDAATLIGKLPLSEKAKSFVHDKTVALQKLDRPNVKLLPVEDSEKVMLHEMMHHFFENSPMGPTYQIGKEGDDPTNKNAAFFGYKFDEEWSALYDKYPVLRDIDEQIDASYDTKKMSDGSYFTERFAYLGERVLEHGADAVPPELRKYYRGILKF